MQRLEFKGSILKPIQIIEEVLNDFTADDSIDAIIQGTLEDLCFLGVSVLRTKPTNFFS